MTRWTTTHTPPGALSSKLRLGRGLMWCKAGLFFSPGPVLVLVCWRGGYSPALLVRGVPAGVMLGLRRGLEG